MTSNLVILAAGAGSRYGGPKQLAPVGPGGEALLEYSVFDALGAGFGRVVLVVRPDDEPGFRRRFEGGMDRRVEIAYAHQSLTDLPEGAPVPDARVKLWGTGHAVLAARRLVDGPFAVVNADDVYGARSYALLADFLRERETSGADLALVGFAVGETLSAAGPVSRALCEVDDDGRLRRIEELPAIWGENGRVFFENADGSHGTLLGDELASMNMWGFVPALFPELERRFRDFLARPSRAVDDEFFLPDAIRGVVEDGVMEVRVLRGGGEWCGLTFPEDERGVVALLSRKIERGDYPAELWR